MAPGSEARSAVRWLALARAGVTSLLVVSVTAAQFTGALPFALGPVLGLIGLSYLLSAASLALLPRVRSPGKLAEAQIYVDLGLETLLIYLTGGPYSVFPFMYLLSILAGSVVAGARPSYAVAATGVLLHGAILAAQLYGWIPPMLTRGAPRDFLVEGSLTILLISGNFCASWTVAYFASHLAARLHQARGDARRSAASLAELQVLHEDIVQSVASGLLTFDRAGAITTGNRTAETLCRKSAAELAGVRWDQVFHQAPSFQETWEILARRGRPPVRFEARIVRADGSRIPVGVSASFLRRELGVICSFQDLTEIKRMEDRVRHADRLAALGRFAAGLAHEIRNPIGSIRGSVEVLRESLRLDGDDRRLMDIVLRESDRLDGIIRDFLDFSRPPRLVRVETDLVSVLEEILLLLANQVPPTVRLVRSFAEPTVKASVDPGRMRQALWNLCLNAVDAMPEGGELRVTVRPRGEGEEAGPAGVEIVIEDTGLGVTADQRPHLFEPFYTTKAHGTGLGLAVVHRVVEDHEGEVRIESQPGVGTRVTITLDREGA